MQILRRLSFLIGILSLIILSASLAASVSPQQDVDLVNLIQQKQIRLIVMRHGEAVNNVSHVLCSNQTPGLFLTEKGIRQVQTSAYQLVTEKIDTVYVSPVYRTLQTAQLVAEKLNIPYQKIIVDRRLREPFFGDLENHTYDEYKACFSPLEEMFVKAVPGGEPGDEVFARLRQLLWKIASNHSHETILLVTHAYNACQISQCLTGSYQTMPEQAEYQIHDLTNQQIGH